MRVYGDDERLRRMLEKARQQRERSERETPPDVRRVGRTSTGNPSELYEHAKPRPPANAPPTHTAHSVQRARFVRAEKAEYYELIARTLEEAGQLWSLASEA
ncbi:hypothetical protein GCM10009765_18070 [Fodinicola feengrottensis]|uniref:Uncharacterized protein n=1 Tax=Fodinicola feengrottensis TaxID=435914 RepID=A0ABN2GCD2_9ACTN